MSYEDCDFKMLIKNIIQTNKNHEPKEKPHKKTIGQNGMPIMN